MRKLALTIVGLSMVASSAMADTANMSKDGLGDFLIAPFYKAKGTVCSDVNVMNTNKRESILAKVVFREGKASNEVDFPIFLGPGDVWSGRVCQVENGDVVLTSSDESNHPQIKNLLVNGKDLTAQSKQAGNVDVDFTTGYVEVYPIAEFDEKSEAKVERAVLVKRWDSLIKGQIPDKLVKRGVDGYSLTGSVSFVTGEKITSTLPMVAFKGTHDKTLTGSAIAYGNDTSPDILLGTKKKNQILKVLQHSSVMFNYFAGGKDQYVVFTYPFGYATEQARKYKVTIRDMEENKNISKEVIFSPTPKLSTSLMNNEVAIVSVADIVASAENPALFKKGQIQIEDITNVNDVQLGAGKRPSFLATYIITDKNSANNDLILDSYPISVK